MTDTARKRQRAHARARSEIPQKVRTGDDLLALIRDAVSSSGHEVERAVTRTGELISSLMVDRNITMHGTLMRFESSFKDEMRAMRDQLAAMERKLGAVTPPGPQQRAEVRP